MTQTERIFFMFTIIIIIIINDEIPIALSFRLSLSLRPALPGSQARARPQSVIHDFFFTIIFIITVSLSDPSHAIRLSDLITGGGRLVARSLAHLLHIRATD